MQVAVRPRFTAGVALVGAGVIAASTMSPVPDIHLPDIHLPSIQTASVQLAALANPLEVYAQVFNTAVTGVNTLAENSVPGELLKQLISNQITSATVLADALGTTGGKVGTALTTQVPQLLQTALTQLAAGDVAGATNALLTIPLVVALPALGLLDALGTVISQPLQNLVNVIKAFPTDELGTQLILSGLLAPLISTPAATAVAIQNVLSAFSTGNPMTVVNAILTAPATIADGFLNGGYGPDLGPLVGAGGLVVKAGGLLSSAEYVPTPDGGYINTGGPLYALQQILHTIATAITPAPPLVQAARTDIAGIPAVDATTVSLETAPASTPSATTPSVDTTTGSGATETSGQTPAAEGAGDTVGESTGESTTAPASSPAEPTGGTESSAPAKDSADTTGEGPADAKPSTDASDGKADSGKSETGVKTGNKVGPKTFGGKHGTKSGAGSHGTAAESGKSTGTSSEAGSGAGSESSSNSAA